MTYSSETREKFLRAIDSSLEDTTSKYGGKLIHRSEDRFVCYFPQTTNQNNAHAFEQVLDCVIEHREKMGPLSEKNLHIGIRRTFYRLYADYETINFENTLEEVYNKSDHLKRLDRIAWVSPTWDIVLGETLVNRMFKFRDRPSQFRKIGDYEVGENDSYGIYILLNKGY